MIFFGACQLSGLPGLLVLQGRDAAAEDHRHVGSANRWLDAEGLHVFESPVFLVLRRVVKRVVVQGGLLNVELIRLVDLV